MSTKLIDALVRCIGEKSLLQKKYCENFLGRGYGDTEEEDTFDALLSYYIQHGETIESLAQNYVDFINDLMEERYFFVQNGCYRYSKIEEVDKKIYQNPKYMKMYMIGLALSTYLLTSHREYMRWFKLQVANYRTGNVWLEVGPGHGEYFIWAINNTDYQKYYGIDISETAVKMSKNIVSAQVESDKQVLIEKKDFFDLPVDVTYDAIVVGEVIEHVEQPQLFLKKIKELSNENTFIYMTTVVNCPQKDHIYLFNNVSEIEQMLFDTGFEVVEKLYVPTNNYSMEKAEKKKVAINVAYILKCKMED